MSLLTSLPRKEDVAVRLRAGGFVVSVRRMIAPIVRQIADERQSRKIALVRRRTAEELAALPASLRRDVAFSEGLKHNDI